MRLFFALPCLAAGGARMSAVQGGGEREANTTIGKNPLVKRRNRHELAMMWRRSGAERLKSVPAAGSTRFPRTVSSLPRNDSHHHYFYKGKEEKFLHFSTDPNAPENVQPHPDVRDIDPWDMHYKLEPILLEAQQSPKYWENADPQQLRPDFGSTPTPSFSEKK